MFEEEDKNGAKRNEATSVVSSWTVEAPNSPNHSSHENYLSSGADAVNFPTRVAHPKRSSEKDKAVEEPSLNQLMTD